ncbi:MAG TPA: response regulator transcription factor [Usitatibacter sp.]|jgi:DNA-binding NarL/FixJ family response regulator|nr:response regulator transcription factor [Usitatibacter sp.]
MKLLIVDDHHLIREGLRPILKRLGDGEETEVLEAASFEAAVEYADRHRDLDLLVLDLRLPNVAGFAALCDLQERHPSLPIVIMSGEDDPELMRQAIEHGALGFIPKSSSADVILNALRLVLSGGTYLPRQIMAAPSKAAATPVKTAGARLTALGLTPRQADVLELLIAGKSNKAICRELHLAEGTVKTHIAAAFKALNVTSRVQAVLAVSRLREQA